MNVLSKSQANKIDSVAAIKKVNAPKIVLGLGKNLAEINYDLLFENYPTKNRRLNEKVRPKLPPFDVCLGLEICL